MQPHKKIHLITLLIYLALCVVYWELFKLADGDAFEIVPRDILINYFNGSVEIFFVLLISVVVTIGKHCVAFIYFRNDYDNSIQYTKIYDKKLEQNSIAYVIFYACIFLLILLIGSYLVSLSYSETKKGFDHFLIHSLLIHLLVGGAFEFLKFVPIIFKGGKY